MRRLLLVLFILIFVIAESRHFTGDDRINTNLNNAFWDSLHVMKDRTLGRVSLGARSFGDRVQDGAWNTISALESKVDNAKQAMLDGSITAAVKMKLIQDQSVPASTIDVHTSNGMVKLSGTVDRPEQEKRATQLAWQAEGVRGVISNLRVRGEG